MMPPLAIGFGALLSIAGVLFYFLSEPHAPTALIPLGFGVPLMILGVIGRTGDAARKHTMHVAAALSLIGTVGGFVMALKPPAEGKEKSPLAVTEQAILGALCAIFLALCVKSFIDARRNRANPPSPPVA